MKGAFAIVPGPLPYPAMNLPMLAALLLMGHIECIAFLHKVKSDSVGCSFGHLIVDCASPAGMMRKCLAIYLITQCSKNV